MDFVAGDRVEVIVVDPGFENSFFEARVARAGVKKVTVVYQTLEDDNGALLRETLCRQRIRPYPPQVNIPIQFNDYVDVWDLDGWWTGTVFANIGNLFTVFFDYMKTGLQYKTYEPQHVRIHQAWRGRQVPRFWIYSRPNAPFYANQRVEVMSTETGLRNSYYGAYVQRVKVNIVEVVYERLVDDEGHVLVEEHPFRCVRPFPSNVNVNPTVGCFVDVWDREGWWKGEVIARRGNLFDVYFNYMKDVEDILEYDVNNIRVHQVRQVDGNAAFWSYRVV